MFGARMCPHVHFAMFKSRQICFMTPCFPANRLGTMAFLSDPRSLCLPFRPTGEAAVPGPARQKFVAICIRRRVLRLHTKDGAPMTPDLLRAIQLSCASAWLVEGRMPSDQWRRCKVIGLLGSAAAAWPLRAYGQCRFAEFSSCCAESLVAR